MTETISIPSKLLEKMIDVAAERRSTPTAAPAPVTPETMALAAKRAGELLSRKIEKYAADHDITYTDAYEVMKTRPDLWKGL